MYTYEIKTRRWCLVNFDTGDNIVQLRFLNDGRVALHRNSSSGTKDTVLTREDARILAERLKVYAETGQ